MKPKGSLLHSQEPAFLYPEQDEASPYPRPPSPSHFKSILILSFHLGLPSGLLTPDLPTKILYAPVLSPICATCHILHSSLFDNSNNILCGVQIIKLLIMQFDHSPVNSSLLGPNILLNTLFSDTLSLHSSSSVSDQVLHPNKKTAKL